ncbi:MAG: hypothetical protein V3U11_02370, partial [Planctomycetota bacterium]
ALVVFDQRTAEELNGAPLEVEGDAASGSAVPEHEEEEEDIPEAPIRGQLAAFLAAPKSLRTVRRSCRRQGLELHRFSSTDIPNPAAHKDQLVLIEIPVGEDRRFDWAKRLKDRLDDDVTVVLLLHSPSRRRVVQGCMAKADTIVAWPCTEPQLSAKLDALLNQDKSGYLT